MKIIKLRVLLSMNVLVFFHDLSFCDQQQFTLNQHMNSSEACKYNKFIMCQRTHADHLMQHNIM